MRSASSRLSIASSGSKTRARFNARRRMPSRCAPIRATLDAISPRCSEQRCACVQTGSLLEKCALALLKMWNSGHPGVLSTIHANDCEHGLVRMQQLIDENAGITANPHVIAHSIDLCIFIEKEASIAAGRKVKQVALVERYDERRQKNAVRQI